MQNTKENNSLILLETLPYIRLFHKKKIVIKIGGSILQDEELLREIVKDLCLLQLVGIRVVLVHGGGPQINEVLDELKITTTFIEGRRVTDKSSIKVIDMVLSGYLNKKIVSFIRQEGGHSVGISGQDGELALAETYTIPSKNINTEDLSLGYVGKLTGKDINTDILYTLMEKDYIPVISPTAPNKKGEILNVNADIMAAAISIALQAEKFILLTNTNGVLENGKRVPHLNIKTIETLIQKKIIKDGMLPKVQSCLDVINAGVKKAHIINGSIPHTLLLEIFTDAGVGTMITKENM